MPWIRIERDRELSIRQHVPMTLPTDPAEGPDRTPAVGTDDDEPAVKHRSGELGEVDTERAVRRAALDEMVRIAEDAGMYVRAARPRPMR